MRVAGNVCPCCGKEFIYRYLCVAHINRQTNLKCKPYVMEHCPILDKDIMEKAIADDNKIMNKNKRLGLPIKYSHAK